MTSNYKLRSEHYIIIRNNLLYLCDRRIDLQAEKFPLTYKEVQDMVLEEVPRKLIETLVEQYGFSSIQHHQNLWMTFDDHRCPRSPIIKILASPGLMAAYEPRNHYRRSDPMARADLSVLPEAKRDALAAWSNKMIDEGRYRRFVNKLVARACDFMPTMWHLLMRWPTLKLGFDSDLQRRAGTLPLRRGLYKWESDPLASVWYWEHKKQIELADTLLLAAELLPRVEVERLRHGQLKATLSDWSKLPDDQV
jgi:hypothetical protein